jgi:hypothetical protein
MFGVLTQMAACGLMLIMQGSDPEEDLHLAHRVLGRAGLWLALRSHVRGDESGHHNLLAAGIGCCCGSRVSHGISRLLSWRNLFNLRRPGRPYVTRHYRNLGILAHWPCVPYACGGKLESPGLPNQSCIA